MTALELFDEIKGNAVNKVNPDATCDVFKNGNGNIEIHHVAVTMLPSVKVIQTAVAHKADLLIVHEPLFYDHMDKLEDGEMRQKKREFVKNSGLTIFRFHDYCHSLDPDMIAEGFIWKTGLKGKFSKSQWNAVSRLELDEPMTARELTSLLQDKLGVKNLRIAGEPDKKGTKISLCLGTPGHIAEELEANDFVLAGEICEWADAERARDYACFGINKAIIALGHVNSETSGMELLAERIKAVHPELEVEFIPSGDVYSYC